MIKSLAVMVAMAILVMSGCAAPKVKLFGDATDPLQEFTLEGTARGKVLVIPVRGIISDAPRERLIRSMPSMVQEIVSQLRLAENDKDVKAILLKVDSPGGSITASDVLYHEIMAFKKRTGVRVVVAMMNVAASGGYYVSLPADVIVAHPTTITGSIGVIFMRPKVTSLMEKIGLEVEVNKSGNNKDMGSPFRPATEGEAKILQVLTEELGQRFLTHVARHRELDQKTLADIATARVYLSEEALELGLVDKIGYLNDAVEFAKNLAGLPKDARVVVYRRSEYPDDNIYNPATMRYGGKGLTLIDLGLPASLNLLRTGFYYIWPAAVNAD